MTDQPTTVKVTPERLDPEIPEADSPEDVDAR